MRFASYYYLREDTRPLFLLEGGAYGHLTHPFEDIDLTFEDVKKMIKAGLRGELKTTQEKTDGQNLLVTWKDGRLHAARNKGHLRNFGRDSLTREELESFFEGRGAIKDAFSFAMRDLENALNALPDEKTDEMFGNGKKFMSIEIIYPETENVIPYETEMIIPHGLIEFDEEGNSISEDKESARELFKTIQKTNADIQKTFKLRPPHDIEGLKVVRSDDTEKQLFDIINKRIAKFGLSDKDTIGRYVEEYFEKIIEEKADSFDYDIPRHVANEIVTRWARNDKSYGISQIKKDIDNKEFKEWFSANDKHAGEEVNNSLYWLKKIFRIFGVELLKNMTKFLALNPQDASKKIKEKLDKEIEEIKSSNDEGAIKKLEALLKKLDDIGGFDSVIPTEGITFFYNGKLYKITGGFGPINQILGIRKFAR